MKSITNYKKLYNKDGYDRVKNPLGLSVFELLPDGLLWEYNSKKYEKKNSDKIISVLTKDGGTIAMVEAPFDRERNRALIINPDKSVKWDVTALLKNAIDYDIFSDVYYIDDLLFFFYNKNGRDFRFSFDITTGNVGKIYESY
ncbi:hypothetical protein J2125_001935 [Erwinia toletana]|uniref:Uncharacterized protein n=1 Tax=Winslowiella toletana TaxID=92490 RepID=A0ABS4P7X0_9GAMM|nr:hypothetical protein [Winslowiella toletana]MBP2168743.1 hypothetical protein [Winslowiella toletana]